MTGTFTHILLDFDGVVVDTETVFAEFDCRLLNETLMLAGLPADLTIADVRPMAGLKEWDKLTVTGHMKGFDPAPLMEGFLARRAAVRPFLFRDHPAQRGAGLAAFMEKHRGRSALVTNKDAGKLETDLSLMGLEDMFDVIVTADPPLRPKPAPDTLLRALSLLNAAPERAAYVGDNALDMEAAKAAGMTGLGFVIEGIARAPARAEALRQAGAFSVLDDLSVL